jgi:organic radical activating enzyme
MKPVVLSVNPWYFCNFRCSFCYLTEQQLSDRKLLPLERLAEMVDEVQAAGYTVEHIDIYGGEVLLLPADYLNGMKQVFHDRGIDDLCLITNLSLVNDVALDDDYELSVSYDFEAREKHEKVFDNMLALPRQFNVLSLVGRKFLDVVTPDEYVHTLNLLSQLWCVELKPYSENQANADAVSFKEFEDFVWAVIKHPDREFYLENESLIRKAAETKTRNAFSDNHIYITPAGRYAVLEFDANDREFFLELDDLAGYQAWCALEKERVTANEFCSKCQFKGGCLSEHLRDVRSLENSCNGFHDLLVRWVDEGSPTQTETRDHARSV